MGSKSFVELIMDDAFCEDLGKIFYFLMFANPHANFTMPSLRYA
jgi:hypothetical protein